MSKMKPGVGRGLGALLGDFDENLEPVSPAESEESRPAEDAVVSLKISDIDPNREQPRKSFDNAALLELADSIRAVGVLQPILVSRNGSRPSWREEASSIAAARSFCASCASLIYPVSFTSLSFTVDPSAPAFSSVTAHSASSPA